LRSPWVRASQRNGVDGGLNPRISGGALKVGTNFAVDLLAARSGSIDACQRRKPPEAVAEGQRLQGFIDPPESSAEVGA